MKPHLVLVPRNESLAGADYRDTASVFRRHAPYVAKIALRLLGHRADVDDVVQDVFVAATRGLDALKEPEAVRGWLAAVTVRVTTQRLRARRLRQWVGLADITSYEEPPAPGASPEQRLLLSQVYQVLEGVSVNARVAWILRNVEGESLETVAGRCGCSLATAKRRISEAQQKIEEAFST